MASALQQLSENPEEYFSGFKKTWRKHGRTRLIRKDPEIRRVTVYMKREYHNALRRNLDRLGVTHPSSEG